MGQAKERLDTSQRQLVGYASAQQIINLPAQSNGVTTTSERSIVAEDNIDLLTFEMTDLRLTAMSAGPIPPNAAELLTGNRLGLFIERLLEDYDHVVVDSPPVTGLADAPLIAARVEGVIYAVGSHGIRSSIVKTALARLDGANARILGGVLTKFKARKAWALTCRGGRELGRVILPNSAEAEGGGSGTLSVPAGCPVQLLTLVARPSVAVGGLTGQLDRVHLAPVR